ncbi:MAG: phosphoribosyltransferase family protein [Caulobacteraceae bacterium]
MAQVAKLERTRDAGEAELLEMIRTRSFRRGKFILTSGAGERSLLQPQDHDDGPAGRPPVRQGVPRPRTAWHRLRRRAGDGGGPVIASMAVVSDVEGKPVKTFFVRKAAKGHGTNEVIEGLAPGESLAGKRVLMTDDVATTGGSTIKAIEAARAAGAVVEDALVIVDRQEGGTEALAALGVTLHSVFVGDDFR